MKQLIKRIIAFSLSICIVVFSLFLFPLPTYAKTYYSWDELRKDATTSIFFIASQLKAVANGEFSNFVQGLDSWEQYWNEDNVAVDSETGEVTYSADLVAFIKQALQEYADETNPFKLQKTYPYKSIPAGLFPSKQTYNAFTSYCSSHYMVVFSFRAQLSDTNDNMQLGDVSEVVDDGGGFIANGTGFFYTVNANWSKAPVWKDNYAFSTNSDGEYEVSNIQEKVYQCTNFYAYNPTTAKFRCNPTNGYLVTKDGGRIRVFNSLAEFKDYNANQRKVYFGKGFYDFDPTEITATWDEISNAIDRMDGILQDILDAITANPGMSEEDIEKLIDALLGKLGEIGDKTDETNSTLKEIADSLSGYFNSMLSGLEQFAGSVASGFSTLSAQLDTITLELGLIYDKIGDMTEEEVSDKTDSLFAQLSSAFSEIGELLKGKFPFCLPNDLYTMLAILSGDTVTVPSGSGGGDVMICAYGNDPPDVSVMGGDGKAEKESNAPVFEIPFVIGSAGIEEKLIIDLSPFDYISKLSRTLMTLYYCACLMNLTFKVIDLGKDIGDD